MDVHALCVVRCRTPVPATIRLALRRTHGAISREVDPLPVIDPEILSMPQTVTAITESLNTAQ